MENFLVIYVHRAIIITVRCA